MTLYRKPQPYRKPRSYRGSELVPAVGVPGTAHTVRAPFQQAVPRGADVAAPWDTPPRHEADTVATYGAAQHRDADTEAPWSRVTPNDADTAAAWSPIAAQDADTSAPWGAPAVHDAAHALPWSETSQRLDAPTRAPWGAPAQHDTAHALRWGTATARQLARSALWRAVAARGAYIALPWGPAGRRETDYVAPWPVEPNPGDPGSDPITVPILPVYVMLPTLSAVILPARTPLDLLSATIDTDAASWCWRFQAALPLRELPKVTGTTDPVEIEITINGYAWTFLVESHSDNRRFGAKTATIQGRSRSAMLAQPYAPGASGIATDDRNASQLAAEAIVGTGWTLLWDAVDWLVPGGTFSYADAAPIDALGQLASAIGARVESHRTDLSLAVKPTHPVSPWAWGSATPYAILPAEICSVFDGQWQGGPNANGIYVYAQNSSFGALVRVTGTGGEVQLPMVVDSLLVSADPARERGRAELARASRIKSERVTIPLFPSPADPGLIPVGALITPTEGDGSTWTGQVVGVQVSASRSGSALSVRQHLDVERHFR